MNIVAKVETVEAPLCVDLDGTLIQTDMLYESLFALLQKNLLFIFLVPLWLLGGKAKLKAEIASRVDIDPSTLPYNKKLLRWLRSEHYNGREIILATATHHTIAQRIADYLGIFSSVEASNEAINLRSSTKANRLVELFGESGFDYAGNSGDDVKIWEHARHAIVVDPDARANKWLKRQTPGCREFGGHSTTIKDWTKALRLHQWLKNALIFVPLVLDQKLFVFADLSATIVAFVAFGLCASSVYLLNDLLDLSLDRRHRTKKNRPMAAGRISIPHALVAAGVLLIAAFTLSLTLNPLFSLVLAIYYCATLAYSVAIKRMLLLDVLTLAGLFTLRVIAGAAATGIALSSWLLAFSVFFFLSLALVKRFVELQSQDETATRETTGRGYRTIDLETLAQSGLASGFAAVLVLALYVDSPQVAQLYAYPQMIWLVCPLVLYMIIRIWILARRNEFNDDPVVFLLTDWRSQTMVAIGAAIVLGGVLI